ncbi:hypothetical protein [Serratia marcescens]|uniref:hypothetical protein n=1 Tax=Serratia marcescens TaxID=615 RepID=UPI002179B958|nr:hypothetical protein [Serratia marcescens]CAI1568376.1 Uncharacterised protein [Serratia marcescens]
MEDKPHSSDEDCGESWATGSFEDAARPLIRWLAENAHPHHTAIVTSNRAELLMGESVVNTDEYLKD